MTARDVVEIAGITYRQLDHWCTTGHLTPFKNAGGSGDTRRFLFSDVVVAATIGYWQRTFRSVPLKLPDGFEGMVRGRLGREDYPPIVLNFGPITAMIDVRQIESDCRTRLPQTDSCPAGTPCATMATATPTA